MSLGSRENKQNKVRTKLLDTLYTVYRYTLYYTRYTSTRLGCLGAQLSTRLSVCKQFRVSQIGFITLHFPHLNIAHFHDI